MPRKHRVLVDPELRRQLGSAAAPAERPVEAVLRLRASRSAPEPAEAQEATHRLLARVAQELDVAPGKYDFNVFPNLGYFVLSAPPAFVRRVLDQPEIASASANRRAR